ncbi:MAG: M6 family metalloprotease domain-containing protein [Prevotella sp.]|nr:M6 family metalloprotease domain-containing protein [Prevotella sp.]
MRKYFSGLLLSLVACTALAVPAKKGIWKTLPLNGTEVRAQLMGNEHIHYWQTENGDMLVEDNGQFVVADMQALRANAMSRRNRASASRQRRLGRRNAIGDFTHYTGQKKGLIILVDFNNLQFQTANDSLRYTRICNEPGYNEGKFRGSVYDYFKAQSYGEFELTFDVVGPVHLDNTYQYYGKDVGGEGNDSRPGEMVATACQAVDPFVDFHDYDWDGDGEVDQVMCIYAGQGQADGGNSNTIWPHEWQLDESDWNSTLTLDGCVINTYAVANERTSSGIEGIGTICHEFSHCLGLPDMYDINYGGNYGMGEWSLMDAGSYNGDGFCPSGYSSFDRYTCGWVNPVELTRNQAIEGMKPLSDNPEVYMVRNEAYENEYFLIENRQQKGWDAELPGQGLLILYVDYDRSIWENNLVNTNYNGYDAPRNDHQRCTPFHASNRSSSYWGVSGTAYPYEGNDSLTNTSTPAAKLYHNNTDGKKLMNKGILNIRRTANGTMAFNFRNSAAEVYIPEGTLLFESFNNCNGSGGNDGRWTTTIASSNFVPDNTGWTWTKAYGGYQCARFGNGSTVGTATTPAFTMRSFVEEIDAPVEGDVYGEALLTFKAAGWGSDGKTLKLSIEGEGAWIEPAEVTMESFAWTDYTVRLGGKGQLRVTFQPDKRFLLDDVAIVKVEIQYPQAISTLTAGDMQPAVHNGYYTLDGRFLGTNSQAMQGGLYIYVNGNTRRVITR